MTKQDELKKAMYFSVGLACITLLVYTSQISDPVNAPKFLLLGIVSLAAVAAILLPETKRVWFEFKWVLVTCALLIISMVFSTLMSSSPFLQNIYGVQGRNTGLLAHLALCGILLSILGFKSKKSMLRVFKGMLIAGLVNVGYCAWVLIFGDFIQWNNPYKSLLGTLGNPNFISSFLAITGIGLVALYLTDSPSLKRILSVSILLLVILFEILKTNSTQGFIVFAIGLYSVGFFIILFKVQRPWLTFSYLVIGLSLFIIGLLGLTNSGPLASLIYQDTLAFRREYWIAGIRMGLKFPVTGVGLDSYGDWYRELRTEQSIIAPGIKVVTNVAHNIYIDAFANGGIVFLVGHLLIFFLTVSAIIKVTKRGNKSDPFFIALTSTWIGYQFQCLISINQIGIAVWGWALSGLILSYSNHQTKMIDSQESSPHSKIRASTRTILSPVAMASGALVGFILYSPPVLADHNWTKAYSSKNADELFNSLNGSYFNPNTSFQYAQAIQIFESNGLSDKARTLAIEATRFNPRSFDAWQLLYYLESATSEEKAKAKTEMLRLDPLNPSIKDLT
jgi:hypothetical protein